VAVGASEMLLILRARDEASRVLRGLGGNLRNLDREGAAKVRQMQARGQALIGLGVGVGAIGAAGLAFFASSTKAAIEYNQAAALTQTQLDKVHGSLDGIKKIGRDVATTLPVAFEQIQPALYDIFSSIDTNMAGAEVLLRSFAHSAVAGQVSLQESGRATIGILNAYHMKVSDVNKVQDVMFQLVRKGVGTYAQFADVIGRATPSAVKAGQSIEGLAGMMAFLTRNGLSTSMAAASAARALDAISNPATQQHFKELGLSVRNSAGEFKPMTQIVQELQDRLGNMTRPQRAKALHDLFKGSGGTIQAMRFFNTAVTQAKQLKNLTGDMINSKGAMQGAYNIMFKQPQTQVQLLKNNIQVLRTEVGDMLVPAFQRTTSYLITAVKWFNNLSPSVKRAIVYVLLITSGLMVLIGIVTVIAGGFLLLTAAAAAAGTSLGAIIAVAAPIIGALIAIGIAVYLVIKYHKQIWAFIQYVWNAIWTFIQSISTSIWTFITGIWNSIYNAVAGPIQAIYAVVSTIFQAIYAVISTFLGLIWTFISGYFKVLTTFWSTVFHVWWIIASNVFKLIFAVVYLFVGLIYTLIKHYWGQITIITSTAWNLWKMLVYTPIKWVVSQVISWIGYIVRFISSHWDTIKAVTIAAWGIFKSSVIDPVKDAYNGIVTWIDKILGKVTDLADKIVAPIKKVTGWLNKLNPLNRNSPSIVDLTNDGWKAMNKATQRGIQQVIVSAKRTNGFRTDMVGNVSMKATAATSPVVPGGNGGPGGPGPTQYFTINTQEIDPVKHAADLGREIAGRVM
jgi:TP901 family phage tail tape measure protein